MTTFQYSPAIIEAYPNIHGGVLIAKDMTNGPTPADLLARYHEEQENVKQFMEGKSPADLDSLQAWRAAFKQFGVNPTKYRSAPEALLRRLTKKGDIPSINTLVDIGNMVSTGYGLPVAIFDTREVSGPITVQFAEGSEQFIELGSDEAKHPKVGEVIFADEARMVVARRWCWRQSASSAANAGTTNAVIVVEALHDQAAEDVQSAMMNSLLELLGQYAGGSYETTILNAASPVI